MLPRLCSTEGFFVRPALTSHVGATGALQTCVQANGGFEAIERRSEEMTAAGQVFAPTASFCVAERLAYEECILASGKKILGDIGRHAAAHCPAEMASFDSCARVSGPAHCLEARCPVTPPPEL